MRYKVGDEVYLPDDTFYELYKNTPLKIMFVDVVNQRYCLKDGLILYEDDIDHEKTATLNMSDLEKIVAEKKKVDIPVDNIKPSHYRKGEIDPIESWYQTMPFDGFRWAMKSHIDKYIHRYESKGGIEDLDKATYFIKRLKEKELIHDV